MGKSAFNGKKLLSIDKILMSRIPGLLPSSFCFLVRFFWQTPDSFAIFMIDELFVSFCFLIRFHWQRPDYSAIFIWLMNCLYLRKEREIKCLPPKIITCSLGGFVEAISVLIACLASFNAFFPSLALVITGRMGLLRCRHTRRLRAAQQNTRQEKVK